MSKKRKHKADGILRREPQEKKKKKEKGSFNVGRKRGRERPKVLPSLVRVYALFRQPLTFEPVAGGFAEPPGVHGARSASNEPVGFEPSMDKTLIEPVLRLTRSNPSTRGDCS